MTTAFQDQFNRQSLNQPAKHIDEPEAFNEEGLNRMAAAIKTADNLDEFLHQITTSNKVQRNNTAEELNTEAGSPVKQGTLSATKVQRGFMQVGMFDPMHHYNSSDEDECTFHPKINENADKLAKRRKTNGGDTNELLYKDAADRHVKGKEHQEIEEFNRERQATKVKIQKKSMKMVLKRLHQAMANLVQDCEESDVQGQMSFEGLGTVLYKLGVFQNLEFIPKDKEGERSSLSINHAKVKPERLAREIMFHENLWNVCKVASSSEANVSTELVFRLLMVLVEEKCGVSDSTFFLSEIMEAALNAQGFKGTEEKSAFAELREQNNLWSLEKIVSEFRRLFDDKTSFMNIYSATNLLKARKTVEGQKQYSYEFTPQTNKKSQKLDTQFFNKTMAAQLQSQPNFTEDQMKDRRHRLYNYSNYLKDKKSAVLESRIVEELAPCTFAPKTTTYKRPRNTKVNETNPGDNTRASYSPSKHAYFSQALNDKTDVDRQLLLYEVAKAYKEKQNQKAYAIRKKEEITEQAHCTFQPKTNKYYESSGLRDQDFYVGVPNGFKKTVERLHKAEFDKQNKQIERDTVPRGENFEKNKSAEFKPPQFISRPKIKRQEVLVYVDVSIGPGRTGRIGIHKGDNAKTLAKNFARTYSLNANMKESLEKLLQSYIQSYFAQQEQQNQAHQIQNQRVNEDDEEDEEDGVDEEEEDEDEEDEEEDDEEEEEDETQAN